MFAKRKCNRIHHLNGAWNSLGRKMVLCVIVRMIDIQASAATCTYNTDIVFRMHWNGTPESYLRAHHLLLPSVRVHRICCACVRVCRLATHVHYASPLFQSKTNFHVSEHTNLVTINYLQLLLFLWFGTSKKCHTRALNNRTELLNHETIKI